MASQIGDVNVSINIDLPGALRRASDELYRAANEIEARRDNAHPAQPEDAVTPPSEPASDAEENADLSDNVGLMLQNTTDAMVWANAFEERFRVFDVVADEYVFDTGLMLGWFANAIEVGKEDGRQREIARRAEDDRNNTRG